MQKMMFKHCFLIAFVWLAISLKAKTASVDNNKHNMGGDRVLEADRKISEHLDNDNQGDYDYDHEAFLGKDDFSPLMSSINIRLFEIVETCFKDFVNFLANLKIVSEIFNFRKVF